MLSSKQKRCRWRRLTKTVKKWSTTYQDWLNPWTKKQFKCHVWSCIVGQRYENIKYMHFRPRHFFASAGRFEIFCICSFIADDVCSSLVVPPLWDLRTDFWICKSISHSLTVIHIHSFLHWYFCLSLFCSRILTMCYSPSEWSYPMSSFKSW